METIVWVLVWIPFCMSYARLMNSHRKKFYVVEGIVSFLAAFFFGWVLPGEINGYSWVSVIAALNGALCFVFALSQNVNVLSLLKSCKN